MHWVFFCFLAAFQQAARDCVSKAILNSGVTRFTYAFYWRFLTTLFLLPVFVYHIVNSSHIPVHHQRFWSCLLLWGILSVGRTYVKLTIIRNLDISLSAPLQSLSPIFVLVIASIFLDEYPPLLGILGIFIVFFGLYITASQKNNSSFFDPFVSLFKMKEAWLIVLLTLVASISRTLNKTGILASTPVVWTFSTACTSIFFILPFIRYEKGSLNLIDSGKKYWKAFIAVGILSAGNRLFTVYAYAITYTAYVPTLKKVAILFNVLIGWLYFKEKNIRQRFIGSIIILVGIMIIAFS